MARSINLREYQQRLITRMMASRERASGTTRIGFQVGSTRWLLQLDDSEQVLTVPAICPSPLTRSWFRGMVEVRGDVYGVVDFAAFMGQQPVQIGMDTRLIVIGNKLGNPTALLVERLLGIQNIRKYKRQDPPEDAPAWYTGVLQDEERNDWCELEMTELINDPQFSDAQLLQVAGAV